MEVCVGRHQVALHNHSAIAIGARGAEVSGVPIAQLLVVGFWTICATMQGNGQL